MKILTNVIDLICNICGIAITSVIIAYPVVFLWNTCFVPAVTIFHVITYWQGVGILGLAMFLFVDMNKVLTDTQNKWL